MIPTVLASGATCLISAIWSATGFMSVVPVTFAPGASLLATSSADTGSVTAVNKTGTSVIAWAAPIALGVAMAKTRSRSASPANRFEIVATVAASACAFCSS